MLRTVIRRCFQSIGFDLYRYPEACERLEPHLRVLLRLHPVDAVIDVGANEGQFASFIRRIDSQLPIHSFEPNPEVFERLQAASSKDENWHAHSCALGRAEGKVNLNITASDDFSSCREPSQFGVAAHGESLRVVDRIEVQMKTLDRFLIDEYPSGDIPHRLILKLDTQGFDAEVFLGAQESIQRASIIITEASFIPIYNDAPAFVDLMTQFESRGFKLSGLFPVTRDKNARIVEADCVFVRG